MFKENGSISSFNSKEIIKQVDVRLIFPEERQRWDSLMRQYHYLGLHSLVGESLRYVAVFENKWLALLGWQSAVLKCQPRDKWIGWPKVLQWQRLKLIANNARFLILPQVQIANLASRILSLNLRRLPSDWSQIHGHPVILAETFVDRSRFTGACYRAANWIVVGQSRGFSKSAMRYSRHDKPKELLVYPLETGARELLCAAIAHKSWRCNKMQTNIFSASQIEELHQRLLALPDCRKKRGKRHRFASILTVGICATLSGARGFSAIAQWGQRLNQNQLQRLWARKDPKTALYKAPSEPTIRRVFKAADVDTIEHSLGSWLMSACAKNDDIAVDGKTVKGARSEDGKQLHLLSAFLHQQAVTVNQRQVATKTNEIPEIKPLLEPLQIKGCVVTADAIHTQRETTRYLVKEKKADYLLTVKENQPTLLKNISSLSQEAFSPCISNSG